MTFTMTNSSHRCNNFTVTYTCMVTCPLLDDPVNCACWMALGDQSLKGTSDELVLFGSLFISEEKKRLGSWRSWHIFYGVVPKGLLTFLGFLGNAESLEETKTNVCGCFFDSQWRFVWKKKKFVLSPFGWWRFNTSINDRINFIG